MHIQVVEEKAAEVRALKKERLESGWTPSETAHAPETRLQMARDMAAQKAVLCMFQILFVLLCGDTT